MTDSRAIYTICIFSVLVILKFYQPIKWKNVGIDLFFRSVARQVSSAPHVLTSVFGMDTGIPRAIKTPTCRVALLLNLPLVCVRLSFYHDNLKLSNCTFVLVHLRGLEPRTHWLRVSCSTNWARGAYCTRGAIRKCSLKTEQRYIWEAMKLRWMNITQQCIEIESNTK